MHLPNPNKALRGAKPQDTHPMHPTKKVTKVHKNLNAMSSAYAKMKNDKMEVKNLKNSLIYIRL